MSAWPCSRGRGRGLCAESVGGGGGGGVKESGTVQTGWPCSRLAPLTTPVNVVFGSGLHGRRGDREEPDRRASPSTRSRPVDISHRSALPRCAQVATKPMFGYDDEALSRNAGLVPAARPPASTCRRRSRDCPEEWRVGV